MQHAAGPSSGYQNTVSYSGSSLWHWLNLGALYHVEHHDLPRIPFTCIARVREIAPELYEDLYSIPSITGLTWSWLGLRDGTPAIDVAGHLRFCESIHVDE